MSMKLQAANDRGSMMSMVQSELQFLRSAVRREKKAAALVAAEEQRRVGKKDTPLATPLVASPSVSVMVGPAETSVEPEVALSCPVVVSRRATIVPEDIPVMAPDAAPMPPPEAPLDDEQTKSSAKTLGCPSCCVQ